MTKFCAIGLISQAIFYNLLIADGAKAQKVQSVKEVYVEAGFDNRKLSDVFEQIESITDFRFTIYENESYLDERFSMKARRISVGQLLKLISRETGLIFQQVNNNIGIKRGKEPDLEGEKRVEVIIQTRTVNGQVTGDDVAGGLPGVNVIIKGTIQGTVTDVNGNYSIEVPGNESVLVFSSVGYVKEEVIVGNRSVINMKLIRDITALEEIVVVGYGTQRKSDITGAVTSFDTEILQERPQTNLVQALQGNVAGVTITTASSSAEDNASIVIRGQNSITASNEPLIILDGIPFNGSFSEINPNDVASMEILKDASSTAIYGSRGANGVILVTTKKGEEGKLKISYSGLYSIDEIAHLPDMQDASQYWNDKFERGVVNNLTQPSNTESLRDRIDELYAGEDTETRAFMMGYPGQTWDGFVDNVLANYPDEVHDRAMLLQLANDFAYPLGGRNTDWVDLATRTGHKQQHNLSFSGGTDDTKYFISSVYTNTEGIAKGDKFERVTFRVNLDQKLVEGLHYGTNTQVGFIDRGGIKAQWGGIDSNGAFLMSPLYVPYNEDGSINLSPIAEDTQIRNPLEALLFDNEDKRTSIITNHYLDLDVPGVKGLKYRLNTGFSWDFSDAKTYMGLNTVEGAVDEGNLSASNSKSNAWIIENILSYTRDFGAHSIFLTALYSSQENREEYNSINGRGFANDVMGFYQPSQAEVLTGDASYIKKRYLSQMFRANYSFDDRYLLTATVRRDGYSAFGTDTKFGVFPSLAVGWNINNESFMQNVRGLSLLKLRLSYGENGNEAIDAYATLPRLTSLNYISPDRQQLFGFYPRQLSNPDLGWETTKSVNLGLDYSFLNGRISGSIDAYTSETFDLLLSETISSVNGTDAIIRNIGETASKGLEFQLSSVNVHTDNFYWRTNLNFSTYKVEIVHVGLKDETGNYIDDVASGWFIGHPVNVNFDYALDRILQKEDFIVDDNGAYVLDENDNYQLKPAVAEEIVLVTNTARPGQPVLKDVNGDGVISGSEDKVIHGDLNPDFLAGMTNTFRFKNWTLSFFLNGVWGVTKVNDLINSKGLGPKRKLNIDYWTPENPTHSLPGVNAGSLLNVPNYAPYSNADFVRLQDITLAYSFPVTKWSKLPFSNLEAYVNVKNSHTFTGWQGLDPEYTTQSDVPRARSYVLGVRISL